MNKYEPFQYPPDYQLANIHHQATKPGKVNPLTSIKCPCCNQSTKEPLKSWYSREINYDFKNYGGAVVTYFWLIKLYAFISFLVLLLYSFFLMITIHKACNQTVNLEGIEKCERFMGIFIITNDHLFTLMEKLLWEDQMARILTLRAIAFAILLGGNLIALYVSGRFQRRFPQPKTIRDFSLIFKNCKISVLELEAVLTEEIPGVEIKEIFTVRKMEPFYSLYEMKLSLYFESLIEENKNTRKSLLKELIILDRKCGKEEQNYNIESDRVIIVFEKEEERNKLLEIFELKGFERIKYLLGFKQINNRMYAEKSPIPEEIIWNNLGSNEYQKIKSKILSVTYFFLLIIGSYVLLYFCMKIVYNRDILKEPWNGILANVVMTLMIPIALTFRSLMNKLSEMRRPNTQTNRTLFIVITTVLFHIIYYIIIPTFYLITEEDKNGNLVLNIITNSTFNFLLVQFILAYVDLMYCSWSKRLKKVNDENKPVGCQKILHQQIEFPRFPIEFKLIILFKTFSFIILFAFESPFIMFLCFGLLVFLYFKDKYGIYHHYRMEIIDNGVQFKFLKIYSCFFSVYTYLIYYLTQLKSNRYDQTEIEFYVSIILVIGCLVIQTVYIKNETFEDETVMASSLKEEGIDDSYLERYERFRNKSTDKETDYKIKDYLCKNGYGSILTDESLDKTKLI